jgi:hypothetical protein
MSGFKFFNMRIYRIILPFFLLILFSSCKDNEGIDTEMPVIDLTIQDAFPLNCDTIYFGESFDLKVLFTDNVELGSYSINIHNNFDHHSHSTEVTECNLNPQKDPVNPYLSIVEYDIPTGQAQYTTNLSISIPTGAGGELYDDGDFHFFISLTDKEGWSSQKGLSIKMFHR